MRWLFRQKMRWEKGLSLAPVINLTLLAISASDRIERAIPISTAVLVPLVVICALGAVWVAGWIMTRPAMQAAEDEAMKDTYPWRRAIK